MRVGAGRVGWEEGRFDNSLSLLVTTVIAVQILPPPTNLICSITDIITKNDSFPILIAIHKNDWLGWTMNDIGKKCMRMRMCIFFYYSLIRMERQRQCEEASTPRLFFLIRPWHSQCCNRKIEKGEPSPSPCLRLVSLRWCLMMIWKMEDCILITVHSLLYRFLFILWELM